MELLYLWIYNYRGIYKQGFNFSSKFNISSVDANDQTTITIRQLNISINEDYVNVFPAQLTNITGIVGRNGSGKSTLLHCLKMMFGQLGRLPTSLIFCLLETKSNTIHTYYYTAGHASVYPITLEFDYSGVSLPEYTVLPAKPYTVQRFEDDNGRIDGLAVDLSQVRCGFLTNSFDQHAEEIFKGIINKSTSAELNDYIKREIDHQKSSPESLKFNEELNKGIYPSNLKGFRKEELDRWIKFIAFSNRIKNPHMPDLPRSVKVSLDFRDKDYIINARNILLPPGTKDAIATLHAIAMDAVRSDNPNNIDKAFVILIHLGIFYYILRHNAEKKRNFFIEEFMMQLGAEKINHETLLSTLKRVISDTRITSEETNDQINTELGSRLEIAVNELDLSNVQYEYGSDFISFNFPVTQQLWKLISIIYDVNYGREPEFLQFSFEHGLSSGEEALLRNCTKLYEIRKEVRKQPLLLLIDEGDLYYHPEWQRRYVKDLMDIIQVLFNPGQVQVILTTHSPFIVSDLPRRNLLYLIKENGLCGVSKRSEHTETFGANIHELFTDAFFLDDSLMGEYASETIEKLIKEIHDETNLTQDKFDNYYRKRISIIGEDFIKAKLFEQLAAKAESSSLIDDIISERMSEIERLRIIRNLRNDQNQQP